MESAYNGSFNCIRSLPINLEHKVFASLERTKVISDDVVIYGRNQKEHDEAFKLVLDRVKEKGLTLNFEKCQFNLTEISFFGIVLSANGVRTDPEKVKAVKNLKRPTNKSELRSMLGLITYFSRFIKDYATLVEPLRELNRGSQIWSWSDKHSEALDKIKSKLSSAEVMCYWRPKAETRLTTDASPVGLGAVLEQKQPDGVFRPLAYASRSLTDVERRYSQTEKEGLAIVWGCERFQLYLIGTEFDLLTDHMPPERIFNPKHKTSARVERWSLRLQPFMFNIRHIPGKDNPTDVLSRMPLMEKIKESRLRTEEYINEIIRYARPAAISLEEIKKATEEDEELKSVIKSVISIVYR